MKTLVGKGLRFLGTLILSSILFVSFLPAAERLPNHERTLLLAKDWNPSIDPTGWWISEKYDGMRARWDGTNLWSRGGNLIHAPGYFVADLPKNTHLDGELWYGRGGFEETVSIARRLQPDERWWRLKFMVFDAPKLEATFEDRVEFLRELLPVDGTHARWVEQVKCEGVEDLIARRDRMVKAGGEGLMIRRPGSAYESGYSPTLLKVKPHSSSVATVIGHKSGKGRFSGMLGSLRVRSEDGREFSIGTGFNNEERSSPPSIGSVVEYRYRGLTKNGIPRFPSFLRVRKN